MIQTTDMSIQLVRPHQLKIRKKKSSQFRLYIFFLIRPKRKDKLQTPKAVFQLFL